MNIFEKARLMLSMKDAGMVLQKYGKISLREYARRFKHPALHGLLDSFLPEGYSASSVLFALAAFTKGQASVPAGSRAFAMRMNDRYLSLGGNIEDRCEAVDIDIEGNRVRQVKCSNGKVFKADYFIAACDANVLYEQFMIPVLTIVYMVITLVLTLLLPLFILLILRHGRKGVTGVWIAGALGFILTQMVIGIPVLQLLGTRQAFQELAKNHPVLFVFLLAFTAGLFETTGRLVVLKVALGKRLSYMTGLAAGAGHGGIDAVSITGLTYINNLVISLFINSGSLSRLIPHDPKLAESIQNAIINTSLALFLVAGFERVLVMMFHIAMSILLTLFIIKRRTFIGFLMVLIIHFALDFTVGLMQVQGFSLFVVEGVVLGFAVFSLIFIIKVRRLFGQHLSIPHDPCEEAVEEGY